MPTTNRTPRCPHGFTLESRLCGVRGCVAAGERWLAVQTGARDDGDDDGDEDEPEQYVDARELPLMLQLVRFGEQLDATEKKRDEVLYGDTGAKGRGVPARARSLLAELARIDETAIEDPGERGVYAVLRSRAEELASFTPPSPKANAK